MISPEEPMFDPKTEVGLTAAESFANYSDPDLMRAELVADGIPDPDLETTLEDEQPGPILRNRRDRYGTGILPLGSLPVEGRFRDT